MAIGPIIALVGLAVVVTIMVVAALADDRPRKRKGTNDSGSVLDLIDLGGSSDDGGGDGSD